MRAPDADWEASRRLLRRVRDVMAAQRVPRHRLDQVVRIIATEVVAEVCSVYIRRGDVLVLSATQGLKAEAVGVTTLAVGEGLVGLVAAQGLPIALADAQAHPNFAYRPETGEEIYHSFLGVPMLRGGRAVGVLVVQNRTRRQYTEDEVETLQTVAMVLAEIVAGEDLPAIATSKLTLRSGPFRLDGSVLNPGLAIGEAVIEEARIPLGALIAEDPKAERERLDQALRAMLTALDEMMAAPDLAGAGEHRDVLETYRMFAEDRGWLERIDEALQSGLTAEAAVRRVQDDMRARLRQAREGYLRERLHDLDDLSERLIAYLTGAPAASRTVLPPEAIVIARSMGPAQLLDYDRARLKAVVLEEGSATAHVAIVARALDIPLVGGVSDALGQIQGGDSLIVDGDHGHVFVRPGADVRAAFVQSVRARAEQQAHYAAMRHLPAESLDGVRVELKINGGFLIDVQQVADRGADGVGLYRTELPFMVRNDFPSVDAQTELYGQVLRAAGKKPVTFRTLDVGGDKVLPYWRHGKERNPSMGWRAIRFTLDRPVMMREQLRALLRAAGGATADGPGGYPLEVMFPMIAEVAEFETARALLEAERRREARRGTRLPERIKVGAMIEVPALLFQLPALLERVDFVSVGSNDLLQFLFAADRDHPRLSGRYDPLAPAVLACLAEIADRCLAAGKPFAFCGEMAGQPLEAMALVGLGFRSISMPPPAIGRVKAMIRTLEVAPLATYVRSLADRPDRSVRAKLLAYARDHAIAL